jgi:glycosyltransferase involved in cell wall biosynthesis
MTIVSTSYSKTEAFSAPEPWLKRISFYTGILECLSTQHKVASIERINYEGYYPAKNVDYFFVYLPRRITRFPVKMHRLIRGLHPDVVLVNGFIFPLQIIQLRFALGKKVKILVLNRAEKPFNGWKKWLQVLADRCVDAYLFTSAEQGGPWITNGNIQDRKKIFEVIQASSSFQPEDKWLARNKLQLQGSPLYLWVGRLEKNKDPLTVVKAFLRFHAVHTNARLFMVYQTAELLEEIKRILLAARNDQAVHLIGEIRHEDLASWYSSADFLISGSHDEGSGIAVSEAMSCGCIPVVTDIPSFRKMTGGTALLYPPGDDNALYYCLERSLETNIPTTRQVVLDHFQRELSFPAIADKINRIINGEHL